MQKNKGTQKNNGLLETVNLTQDAHKIFGSFSSGMKQRALITQALLNDSEILILDDLTTGLDPKERIRNFISEIAEDKILLIFTHVMSDIDFIAKDIILIKNDKLIIHDNPHHLIKQVNIKVYEVYISLSSYSFKIITASQISPIAATE